MRRLDLPEFRPREWRSITGNRWCCPSKMYTDHRWYCLHKSKRTLRDQLSEILYTQFGQDLAKHIKQRDSE